MKIEKFWMPGRLCFGIGISSELWHTERSNGSKVINLIHLGFTADFNPHQKPKASMLTLTLIWLTMRIGVVKWKGV